LHPWDELELILMRVGERHDSSGGNTDKASAASTITKRINSIAASITAVLKARDSCCKDPRGSSDGRLEAKEET